MVQGEVRRVSKQKGRVNSNGSIRYGRKIRIDDNRQLGIESTRKDRHILFVDSNGTRKRLVDSQGIERDATSKSWIHEKTRWLVS